MKIGFISFPVPGHFNPMSALARQLQSRSHDVVMFSLPVGESLARAADLPFIPFGEKEFAVEHSSEVVGKVSRLKGKEGLQFTVNAQMAVASLIGVLPIYVTAIFAQKWLVRGLTTGAGR